MIKSRGVLGCSNELTVKSYFVGATHEDHDLARYLFLFPALFYTAISGQWPGVVYLQIGIFS